MNGVKDIMNLGRSIVIRFIGKIPVTIMSSKTRKSTFLSDVVVTEA